jgi:hypothetical protein
MWMWLTGFCWHRFPRWRAPEDIEKHLASVQTGKRVSVTQTVQTRKCLKCDAVQARMVST